MEPKERAGAPGSSSAPPSQDAAGLSDPTHGGEHGGEGASGTGEQPVDAGMTPLKEQVIEVLRTVYDPEIPVDIYELGLIYEVRIDALGNAYVKMTLTSPMCPVAGSLPGEVEAKVKSVDGISRCEVDLVFDPPWNPTMMSEAAKLKLNMF